MVLYGKIAHDCVRLLGDLNLVATGMDTEKRLH